MAEQKNHRLLQNALEILNYIAKESRFVSFKELCSFIDLPKSSVHNLVQTLCNMNYLLKKENYNEYGIGLNCFEVGNSYLTSNPFYSLAKQVLESMSVKSGETSHFGILDGTDVVYLYKFDSQQPLNIFSHIGKRIPAHAAAVGKALLTAYSDEEIKALYRDVKLQSLTPNTITDLDVLLEQIDEIRQLQFAYESEESTPYITCIATPIHNSAGNTVAAISISIPVFKKEERSEELKRLLYETKKKLETSLFTLNI